MNNKNEIPFFESEQNLIFNGEPERTRTCTHKARDPETPEFVRSVPEIIFES